ncbi:alanine racemase [Prochlorococcus marinus]|uniref:Alanine racemase n=1 Tax=Prochlorococcus marinus XMU1408 TaxID=2213228 RepID=A0A318R044_PROMR|nr:alanine racemase [Prochlorococcus marinus]MBW3042747.1 alanine racemase [Prochlorococcus marinus str. XMU1408]PYE00577.1 alanine racemase [Prochlorococcus marinus XMU1408]
MSNIRKSEKLVTFDETSKSVIKPDPCSRAWVEVDSKAIENNARVLKNYIGKDCLLMAVVKADGYGHGAETVAKAALNGGADTLGVATLEEGIQLRNAGLTCQILILGNLINSEELYSSFYWDLIPTISGIREAIICNNIAKHKYKKFVIHLKVDTGMTRLGCNCNEVEDLVSKIDCLDSISLQGIYSHLAIADEDNLNQSFISFTQIQLNRFEKVLKDIGVRSNSLCRHLANSAGTLSNKQLHFDMVRVGLSLYGYLPINNFESILNLQPALKVKARVTLIREVQEGTGVGYGHLFKTKRESKLAVVSIGYADGVSRALSGKISASIDGVLVPQVGSIAMDQMVFDITDKPDIRVGQVLTLLGTDGENFISPQYWSDLSGSIPWEVLCSFRNRLPRVIT